MAFGRVNHEQTRDHGVHGVHPGSPCGNRNGAFNRIYENMKLVRPGDVERGAPAASDQVTLQAFFARAHMKRASAPCAGPCFT